MTKVIRIQTVVNRKNWNGVQYLIYDTETNIYKTNSSVLPLDFAPLEYGRKNVEMLFDTGIIVPNGERELDKLDKKQNEAIYESAIFEALKQLRNGGDLSDMNQAMQAVYTSADVNVSLLTDFYTNFRDANDNQRYQFLTLMLFTLNGLIRQSQE